MSVSLILSVVLELLLSSITESLIDIFSSFSSTRGKWELTIIVESSLGVNTSDGFCWSKVGIELWTCTWRGRSRVSIGFKSCVSSLIVRSIVDCGVVSTLISGDFVDDSVGCWIVVVSDK
jgi:hypothetical protein